MRIPDTLLLAVCAFGPDLPAERVAAALGKGVQAGGMPEPDLCPIEDDLLRTGATTALLEALRLDARLRGARAVIVGEGHLSRETLLSGRGSTGAVFEIATRARQSGVPAYAVTGADELDAFDARMLDLQVILEARGTRGLSAAGRKLAKLA
jgi:glycerate 2-kinase